MRDAWDCFSCHPVTPQWQSVILYMQYVKNILAAQKSGPNSLQERCVDTTSFMWHLFSEKGKCTRFDTKIYGKLFHVYVLGSMTNALIKRLTLFKIERYNQYTVGLMWNMLWESVVCVTSGSKWVCADFCPSPKLNKDIKKLKLNGFYFPMFFTEQLLVQLGQHYRFVNYRFLVLFLFLAAGYNQDAIPVTSLLY